MPHPVADKYTMAINHARNDRRRRSGFLAAVLVVGSMSCTSAKEPTTHSSPALRDFPGFGVCVPDVAAPDFEPVSYNPAGLLAGTVAAWRRVNTHPFDPARDEIVWLLWELPNVGFDEPSLGSPDPLTRLAQNPLGDVRAGSDDYVTVAKRVKVPHPTTLPAIRFERPGNGPGGDGHVRTEATLANHVGYVLIHQAPVRQTDSGVAFFNRVAERLSFTPPVSLGHALATGETRVTAADAHDKPAFSFCLPEPFRAGVDGRADAQAYDLSVFGAMQADTLNRSTAELHAMTATRELPREMAEDNGHALPAPTWARDEADVRISNAVSKPRARDGKVQFFAGGKIGGGPAWLWVRIKLPATAVTDAGGEAAIDRLLAAVLATARPAGH